MFNHPSGRKPAVQMRYEDDEYYDPDAGKGKMLRDLNQIRMDDDNNPSLRKNLNIGEWKTNSSGNEESEINSSEEDDFYGDHKEKLEKSALNLHPFFRKKAVSAEMKMKTMMMNIMVLTWKKR